MEVFLTIYTVKVVDAGRTQTFNGVDMTKAVTVPVQPKAANDPLYYTVVIHLDENVYGPGAKYTLDLRPGIITNQPTWTNNPRGAGACIDALEPIIRKQQPGGGGGGTVDTIVPGDGIDVDSTDPANPIVSAKVDGVTIGFNGSGELEVPAGGGGYVPTTRTISTTSPLTGGGDLSANRTFAIPQANGSTNGYLSSSDWTTFNNKQAAGNYITALTGDGTASGPGSAALTLATVNANVGTFGSATQSLTITANSKGLVTAVSAQTVTPAVGSITGLGTGVSTALSNNADSASGFVTQTGGDSRYVLASTEIISVLGSTQTTTSNTLVDCTGLSVAVDANATYQIEGFILFQSASATNGIWVSLNGPAGFTNFSALFFISVSAISVNTRVISAYNAGSATSDVPAANTTSFILVNGALVNGATAGTLQFRFASEGAGTTVRIMAGSSIRLRKVA